jgi:hypothetical protein
MHPRQLRYSSLKYSRYSGILGPRALLTGRLARLGATPDFHHGLLQKRILQEAANRNTML